MREAFEKSVEEEPWLKKYAGFVNSNTGHQMLCLNLPNYKPVFIVSQSVIDILSHKEISSLISPLNPFFNHEALSGYCLKLNDRQLILGNQISDELGMKASVPPTQEQLDRIFNNT